MCDNYKKFDKMMKNKRKLAKFEAFLESEFSPENLEFYKRVTKFKKSKNLEEDAKQIYIKVDFLPTWIPLFTKYLKLLS